MAGNAVQLGDGQPVNVKDMAFKLFWTLVPVVAGFVGASVTDWNPAFGTTVAAVVQIVTSFARQKLGATPPEAPPTQLAA